MPTFLACFLPESLRYWLGMKPTSYKFPLPPAQHTVGQCGLGYCRVFFGIHIAGPCAASGVRFLESEEGNLAYLLRNNSLAIMLPSSLKEPWFRRCFIPHLSPQLLLVKGKAGVITCFTEKEIEAWRG